jgi:hypothetical protein
MSAWKTAVCPSNHPTTPTHFRMPDGYRVSMTTPIVDTDLIYVVSDWLAGRPVVLPTMLKKVRFT